MKCVIQYLWSIWVVQFYCLKCDGGIAMLHSCLNVFISGLTFDRSFGLAVTLMQWSNTTYWFCRLSWHIYMIFSLRQLVLLRAKLCWLHLIDKEATSFLWQPSSLCEHDAFDMLFIRYPLGRAFTTFQQGFVC